MGEIHYKLRLIEKQRITKGAMLYWPTAPSMLIKPVGYMSANGGVNWRTAWTHNTRLSEQQAQQREYPHIARLFTKLDAAGAVYSFRMETGLDGETWLIITGRHKPAKARGLTKFDPWLDKYMRRARDYRRQQEEYEYRRMYEKAQRENDYFDRCNK